VDRPQQFSSQPPVLYGFIPRTVCGERVKDLMEAAHRGDGDALDICVISERPINRSEVILNARVIGGVPMLDGNEADDKIIAILEKDNVWKNINDITNLPDILVERLRHYFLTYKLVPGKESKITIGDCYGSRHACNVIKAAVADYEEHFGVS
jgi:inorganic pyrophosphatase